jgi:hypothetical protein
MLVKTADKTSTVVNIPSQVGTEPINVVGAGPINLQAAFSEAPPTAPPTFISVPGGGSLEASRGGLHLFDETRTTVASGCQATINSPAPGSVAGTPLCGERTIFNIPFSAVAHANHVENKTTWYDSSLGQVWRGDGQVWTGKPNGTLGFVAHATLGSVWPSVRWMGTNWTGQTWLTDNWTGNRWHGNRWTGNRWTGNRWHGNRWHANSWSSAGWK